MFVSDKDREIRLRFNNTEGHRLVMSRALLHFLCLNQGATV